MRAVAGAVQQFQARMALQVGGDRLGVLDAVVVAPITAIAGARGNVRSSWSGNLMKSAARRRPSRHAQVRTVTSSAPNTVTCWFLPGVRTCGRMPRRVQLARTLNRPIQRRTVDGWHSSSAAISAGASPPSDSSTITARSPWRHGRAAGPAAARSGRQGCWRTPWPGAY